MPTAARYDITYVCSANLIKRRSRTGAPTEGWMIDRGISEKAMFVIRYFPSRKGWRILDIRAATKTVTMAFPPITKFEGQVRGRRFWPTEDAAVMYAIHSLSGHSNTS